MGLYNRVARKLINAEAGIVIGKFSPELWTILTEKWIPLGMYPGERTNSKMKWKGHWGHLLQIKEKYADKSVLVYWQYQGIQLATNFFPAKVQSFLFSVLRVTDYSFFVIFFFLRE